MDQSQPAAVDFAFLSTQTLADTTLERELLELFVAQGRGLLVAMADRSLREQNEAAHLMQGSARGIGAWPTADAAERFEQALPGRRPPALAALRQAFAAAEAAIDARLTAAGP